MWLTSSTFCHWGFIPYGLRVCPKQSSLSLNDYVSIGQKQTPWSLASREPLTLEISVTMVICDSNVTLLTLGEGPG